MLKKKRGRTAQRMRRRSQKQKIDALEIRYLSEDAAIGTYRIDRYITEMSSVGTKYDSPFDLRKLRHKTWIAGRFALLDAKIHFDYEPKSLLLVKQLFSDLNRIEKSLERILKLEKMTIIYFTNRVLYTRPRSKGQSAEVDELLLTAQRMREAIQVFRAYKPRGKPGNYDPLTRGFISELFEVWCEIIFGTDLREENQLFFKFLIAAWQDLNLPNKDEEGQSLEGWLADRLRKQFPEGVRAARLRRQDVDFQPED
jgi:hypothetical protein